MNVAIFASGGGSNAGVIINTLYAFVTKEAVKLAVVVTNKEKAGVLDIAHNNYIATEILKLKDLSEANETELYMGVLQKHKIDFIILAGYLKKLPKAITTAYPQKIINIHPALLPAYGGAGMYGKHVHEAVIAAGEKESGITVHFVDEVYDHGKIIFQAKCIVDDCDDSESLAKKVLNLEHQYYTATIAKTILSQISVK